MPFKRKLSQKKRVSRRREKKYKRKNAHHRMTRNKKQGGNIVPGSKSSKIMGYLTDIEKIIDEIPSTSDWDNIITRAVRISESIRNSGMSNSMVRYEGPTIITIKDEYSSQNSRENIREILKNCLYNLETVINKKEADIEGIPDGFIRYGIRARMGIESGIVPVRAKYDEVNKKFSTI
jgi:hypothetical protein